MNETSADLGPSCPRCQTGTMSKLESGWTCGSCQYAPFQSAPADAVSAPDPLVPREEPQAQAVSPAVPEETPEKVLFSAREKHPNTMRLLWGEAGGGLLFSYRTHLATLPPGEPVPVEVAAYNRASRPLSLEYDVRVTSKSGETVTYHSRTGDLPPDGVFDTTYQVKGPAGGEACLVAVTCQALPPTGSSQSPDLPPPLSEGQGPSARVQPIPPSPVSFRTSVYCPRCDNRMAWSPGAPHRPRAWVCDDCGHRVETGMLG